MKLYLKAFLLNYIHQTKIVYKLFVKYGFYNNKKKKNSFPPAEVTLTCFK